MVDKGSNTHSLGIFLTILSHTVAVQHYCCMPAFHGAVLLYEIKTITGNDRWQDTERLVEHCSQTELCKNLGNCSVVLSGVTQSGLTINSLFM